MFSMFTIVKIFAIGTNKRFMWIRFEPTGETFCIRISDKFYGLLRDLGIPTSQSLRGKKNG